MPKYAPTCRWCCARTRLTAVCATLLLLAGAQVGRAQSSATQPGFKRVEQGREDAGPLARSIRVAPTDLRLPIGFDQVYRLERSAKGAGGDLYARRSGGLTAVFPRSQYGVSPGGGLIAEVPAGTTFYIGNLPDSVTGEDKPKVKPLPETYVDRSARPARADLPAPALSTRSDDAYLARSAAPRTRPSTPTFGSLRQISGGASPTTNDPAPRAAALVPSGQRSAPPRPSVFTDEDYRRQRVQTLLQVAATAKAPPRTIASPPASFPAATNETPRR